MYQNLTNILQMSYFFVLWLFSINFMIFWDCFKHFLQFVHVLLPKKWLENLEVSVSSKNIYNLKFWTAVFSAVKKDKSFSYRKYWPETAKKR